MEMKMLFVVSVAAMATMAACAEERIVSVAYRDAKRLAVGLADIAEARSLWVAMDTADKGETAADWSHWYHAADVAAGTTIVEIALPRTATVGSCKTLRCALLPANVLPGAERLASITPANAIVKTDFRPTGRARVEMDAQMGAGGQALFCARAGNNYQQSFSLMHFPETQLRYDYGTASAWKSYGTVAVGSRYTVAMGASGLTAVCSDGTVAVSYSSPAAQEFTAGSDLYLFAAHNSGSNLSSYFTGAVYGVKAWSEDADSSSLALDLIPARRGGVVGLFDVAGGAFLTPSNGGSLTAGDKTADAGTPLAWSAATGMDNILVIAACDMGAKRLDVKMGRVVTAGSLWVAYGTADAGGDIADWPHYACAGEVKAGETQKRIRLPKGWDGSVTCARVFLLASDALPGAARLASVAPKSALVKTGFRPTGQSRVELDAQLGTGAQCLFCSRLNMNNQNYFSIMHMGDNDSKLRYDYGTASGGYTQYGTVAKDTRYAIVMGAVGLYATKTDGTAAVEHAGTPEDFTAGSDLCLFAAHSSGTKLSSYFNGVFYGFKAWDVDTVDSDCLALDLVPAKKNTVVGLYDRTSGAFLTASAGSLEAGAEVAAPAGALSVSAAYVHAPCSVTVVSQTSRQLTVALAGVEADSELWIGADTEDRADNTLGWSEYVKVADVVCGQTSATVALPEAWRAKRLKFRCILYSKEAAPGYERYFSAKPWNAYVNMRVVPTGKTSVETEFCYASMPAPGNEGLFCARGAGSANPFAFMHLAAAGLRFDYQTANPVSKFLPLPLGTRQVMRMDAAGITLNDAASPQLPNTPGEKTFTAGGELYLLAMHAGGTGLGSYATGTFYGSRAWSDYQNRNAQTLLFDIVPCRQGNGVVLVDRKTRKTVPLGGGSLAAGTLEFMGDGVIAQSATVDKAGPGLSVMIR